MLNSLKTVVISIISSLFIIFTTAVFAENWHYSIIIDAGSAGSRLHLFRYHTDTSLPVIEEVPLSSNKTLIALASFATNPGPAISSLDDLFNVAINTLKNEGIDPRTISVSILGTAGIRFLSSDKQQDIYTNISKHLEEQYSFPPTSITARTITGEEEGIYDWLAINYLAKNFNASGHTLGCIDIGGASVEIVFALPKIQPSNTLTINGQQYTLYSKSILGLGQDEARKNINESNASTSCYPAGYISPSNNTGNFNFQACSNLYLVKVLDALQKNNQLPIPPEQKFIGVSGVYYVFKFFTSTAQVPSRATLENAITSICTPPQAWQELKKHYQEDNYLANYCANGVYIDELLFGKNGYQLQDSQLSQVENVDWPLGALLYQLSSHTGF